MDKAILAVLIAALAGGAYAQSNYTTSNDVPKSTAPQPAGATARIGSPPPAPGYVGSGAGVVATSPFGLCWHGGAEWTPDKAAAPCDMTPTASAPVAQGANVDRVVLTGHADRIGSEDYNQQLSEERAQAVADYLAQKGVDSTRITAEGKGKSDPVTGSECNNLGKDSNKNQKLIACLQPDRRVDAELLGSRDSTASTGSASTSSAGSTSNSSSTGSASGSSSSESGSTTNK
jgi:OOP family OmpA-OmpF porin